MKDKLTEFPPMTAVAKIIERERSRAFQGFRYG